MNVSHLDPVLATGTLSVSTLTEATSVSVMAGASQEMALHAMVMIIKSCPTLGTCSVILGHSWTCFMHEFGLKLDYCVYKL